MLINGKCICIIPTPQLATCALTFKVASLSARPEWYLVQCVPGCALAWVFFRDGFSRYAIMVAMTKLRDVVMLLQLPEWEVFFSIFLLSFKPLTKSVQQKAKQASCSGTEKVYTHTLISLYCVCLN